MRDWLEQKFIMLGTVVLVAAGLGYSLLPIWY
jgi:hypothetical protein